MKIKFLLILCLLSFSAFSQDIKKFGNITIAILKGDMVTCEYEHNNKYDFFHADALVNAANKDLSRGGGVCGAIFSLAEGNEKQLQNYLKKNHPHGINPGQAIISPSFNLKSFGIQNIIHAVGPIYLHHTQPIAAKLLYDAYENSLLCAHEHNLQSVAFPFISSGIYGYPKKEAATIALNALVDYAKKNATSSITHIYIVLNNEFDYTLFTNCFDQF